SEPAGERTPTEVEHARALDSAVADERHVGGAATDVDEDPALGPDLRIGARPSECVRLGDRGGKLQVELPDHRLDGIDVRHWGEGVEDGDLQVLAREADGVSDRVAVDPNVGDRRVHE